MTHLNWKIGFEVELLAPAGRSRKDLAEALARAAGGGIRRCFYPQSEPSLVPDVPVFHNLVLGYDVLDAAGERIARCVDDLTLQSDLDRNAPPRSGWYRILSDDPRLLRLVMARCDPDAELASVLLPLAALFGTEPTREADDVVKVADETRAPVALATTLPGERERPCELITAPISERHTARLDALLAVARDLGFTVPAEAAVHLHFDAARLKSPAVFRRLVETVGRHGASLRRIVGTNPRCRRLGRLPEPLFALAGQRGFDRLSWAEAEARLRALDLSKYVDFNVLNLVHDMPGKPTFEVRILPGSIDTAEIIGWALLFQAILEWCVAPGSERDGAGDIARLIAVLPAPEEQKRAWIARAR